MDEDKINKEKFVVGLTNDVAKNLQDSALICETKELIQELGEEITAISKKIDPKLTKMMGNDLQRFCNQIRQPHPQRKQLETSLDCLKETVKAIDDEGVPALIIINKLIMLLPGL
jgi:hypothetical protein